MKQIRNIKTVIYIIQREAQNTYMVCVIVLVKKPLLESVSHPKIDFL
jgi:hypothetical protein